MALGIPIKYGVFRMKPETPDFDPTRFHLKRTEGNTKLLSDMHR
jgi:hypothetical protein